MDMRAKSSTSEVIGDEESESDFLDVESEEEDDDDCEGEEVCVAVAALPAAVPVGAKMMPFSVFMFVFFACLSRILWWCRLELWELIGIGGGVSMLRSTSG